MVYCRECSIYFGYGKSCSDCGGQLSPMELTDEDKVVDYSEILREEQGSAILSMLLEMGNPDVFNINGQNVYPNPTEEAKSAFFKEALGDRRFELWESLGKPDAKVVGKWSRKLFWRRLIQILYWPVQILWLALQLLWVFVSGLAAIGRGINSAQGSLTEKLTEERSRRYSCVRCGTPKQEVFQICRYCQV